MHNTTRKRSFFLLTATYFRFLKKHIAMLLQSSPPFMWICGIRLYLLRAPSISCFDWRMAPKAIKEFVCWSSRWVTSKSFSNAFWFSPIFKYIKPILVNMSMESCETLKGVFTVKLVLKGFIGVKKRLTVNNFRTFQLPLDSPSPLHRFQPASNNFLCACHSWLPGM